MLWLYSYLEKRSVFDSCQSSQIIIIIIIIIIYLYSVQLQPGASHRRFYDVKSNKNVFRSRLKADRVRSWPRSDAGNLFQTVGPA